MQIMNDLESATFICAICFRIVRGKLIRVREIDDIPEDSNIYKQVYEEFSRRFLEVKFLDGSVRVDVYGKERKNDWEKMKLMYMPYFIEKDEAISRYHGRKI